MKLVRVTEVISPWSGLDKIPEATLQHAAERGTAVHDYCSRIAQGEFIMNIDQECQPYVESFQLWFDSQVVEVLLSEKRLNDEALGYTGQIDLVVTLKEGIVTLVDLKTPVTSYPTWKMQIAAYRNLLQKDGVLPERTGSLQLHPKGKTPNMKWYEDSATDFNAFLSALNVYNYIRGGK
jgi:hypothetical protein